MLNFVAGNTRFPILLSIMVNPMFSGINVYPVNQQGVPEPENKYLKIVRWTSSPQVNPPVYYKLNDCFLIAPSSEINILPSDHHHFFDALSTVNLLMQHTTL